MSRIDYVDRANGDETLGQALLAALALAVFLVMFFICLALLHPPARKPAIARADTAQNPVCTGYGRANHARHVSCEGP